MEDKEHLIRQISEKKIQVLTHAVVPENNNFNIVDSKGVLLARLGPGSTNTFGIIDCVLIECPPTFPAGTRCWQCQDSSYDPKKLA
jgi:hypothetical protein